MGGGIGTQITTEQSTTTGHTFPLATTRQKIAQWQTMQNSKKIRKRVLHTAGCRTCSATNVELSLNLIWGNSCCKRKWVERYLLNCLNFMLCTESEMELSKIQESLFRWLETPVYRNGGSGASPFLCIQKKLIGYMLSGKRWQNLTGAESKLWLEKLLLKNSGWLVLSPRHMLGGTLFQDVESASWKYGTNKEESVHRF